MENKIEFAMCLLAQMSIRELMDKNNCDMTTAIADFMESTTAVCLFDKETGLWENGPDYIVGEYEQEKIKSNGIGGSLPLASIASLSDKVPEPAEGPLPLRLRGKPPKTPDSQTGKVTRQHPATQTQRHNSH